jgi:hypothetical protein
MTRSQKDRARAVVWSKSVMSPAVQRDSSSARLFTPQLARKGKLIRAIVRVPSVLQRGEQTILNPHQHLADGRARVVVGDSSNRERTVGELGPLEARVDYRSTIAGVPPVTTTSSD